MLQFFSKQSAAIAQCSIVCTAVCLVSLSMWLNACKYYWRVLTSFRFREKLSRNMIVHIHCICECAIVHCWRIRIDPHTDQHTTTKYTKSKCERTFLQSNGSTIAWIIEIIWNEMNGKHKRAALITFPNWSKRNTRCKYWTPSLNISRNFLLFCTMFKWNP